MKYQRSIAMLAESSRAFGSVAYVDVNEGEAALGPQPFEIGARSLPREIVENDNLVAALQKTARGITSDEPRTTRDNNFHFNGL